MERPREVKVEVERPRCPYCHEEVAGEGRKTGCERCLAWHHRECWEEHGGCSGCRTRDATSATVRVAPHETEPAPPVEQPWRETEGLSWSERTLAEYVVLFLMLMFVVLLLAGLLAAGLG